MVKPIFSRDNVEKELLRLIMHEFATQIRSSEVEDRDALETFLNIHLRPAIARAIQNYMRRNGESALALACKCQDPKVRVDLIHTLMKDTKKRLSGR